MKALENMMKAGVMEIISQSNEERLEKKNHLKKNQLAKNLSTLGKNGMNKNLI
jgi:hypothetical protein